jgi:hypothetical protein
MSKNHAILILGHDVPQVPDQKSHDKIKEAYLSFINLETYYLHNSYKILSLGHSQDWKQAIRDFFKENPCQGGVLRVDISAHGKVEKTELGSVHKLSLYESESTPTSELLDAIYSFANASKYLIHLWSCFAGSCLEQTDQTSSKLRPGSVIFTHGSTHTDAWSKNLYDAHLRSIKRYNPDQAKETILIPQDAIESLRVAANHRNYVLSFDIDPSLEPQMQMLLDDSQQVRKLLSKRSSEGNKLMSRFKGFELSFQFTNTDIDIDNFIRASLETYDDLHYTEVLGVDSNE